MELNSLETFASKLEIKKGTEKANTVSPFDFCPNVFLTKKVYKLDSPDTYQATPTVDVPRKNW